MHIAASAVSTDMDMDVAIRDQEGDTAVDPKSLAITTEASKLDKQDDASASADAAIGLDRREQLRRYKEAKQQQVQVQVQQRRMSLSGGMPSMQPPNSLHHTSRRESVDGAFPTRTGAGSSHNATRAAAGELPLPHRLPPSAAGQANTGARAPRPFGAVPPAPRPGPVPKARAGPAFQNLTPMPMERLRHAAQVPLPPESELGGGWDASRPGPSPSRSSSPFVGMCRKSDPGGASFCATPRQVQQPSSAGGAVPVVAQDTKSLLRHLRVQDLQWRYLNAKVLNSANVRKQKSEKAIAAAVLATAELRGELAMGAARQERDKLSSRIEGSATTALPLLQHWAKQQEVLGPVRVQMQKALECALTNVPLINGACCSCNGSSGSGDQGTLRSLSTALDRGLRILSEMKPALSSLLLTPASGQDTPHTSQTRAPASAPATSTISPHSSVGAQAVGQAIITEGSFLLSQGPGEQLPTARVLVELVEAVLWELSALDDVMGMVQRLRELDMHVASLRVQTVAMQRAKTM